MPEWLHWLSAEFIDVAVIGRLLLAALLGSIIGIERERSQKAAGFRTNILICVGAALIMEVSKALSDSWGPSADPTRMPAQIVSGIGFLGAGTILVARGGVVVGLTTAATIWAVAGVGIAVGAQAYTHAVAATLLIVFVLTFLARIEDWAFGVNGVRLLELDLSGEAGVLERVRETLGSVGATAKVTEIEKHPDRIRTVLEVRDLEEDDDLLDRLRADADVYRVALIRRAGG